MTKQSAPQLEPVRVPSAAGWLTPAEAAALLGGMFGPKGSPGVRTVQMWCHRRRNPLPHVALGGRLLIHRDELLAWVNRGGPITAAPATNGGPDGE